MEVTYAVNVEKRTVVAYARKTKKDFIHYLQDKKIVDEWGDFFSFSVYANNRYYFMPDSFVGIAKCSLEDEWNEEIGKKIAYNKLMQKYNNSFIKRMNIFADDAEKLCEKMVNTFNKYIDNANRLEQKRVLQIEALLNKEED